MVAFSGPQTVWPVTEAGVLLASPDNPAELHDALVCVLSEAKLCARLRRCNGHAYREHFSWPGIATRFAALLKTI